MTTLIAKATCWLLGHRWVYLRAAGCHVALMHLSTLAAADADCERCGRQWRDYEAHAGHGL